MKVDFRRTDDAWHLTVDRVDLSLYDDQHLTVEVHPKEPSGEARQPASP